MTDTVESLRAERDALLLKLWHISTGREAATFSALREDTATIARDVSRLLCDVLAQSMSVQIGYRVPEFLREQVTGGIINNARVDVTVEGVMHRDAVRLDALFEMPRQTVAVNISRRELEWYRDFTEEQRYSAGPVTRPKP